MKALNLILLTLALLAGASVASAEPWKVDSAHSTVGFKIRHFMISDAKGEFRDFDGVFNLNEGDLTASSVSFEIDAGSVDTRNAKRDEHLRSPDFFDTAKYPKLSFKSTSVKKAKNGYLVHGNLSMHGVTKPITLTVELTKPVKTPFGYVARGAKVQGKLNRKDFGLTWNKALDAGGLALGEQVEIAIDLELTKG